MGLSLLQSVQEEADHSEEVSRLKGEVRDSQDEIELKETLLKKSKESSSLLEGQIASLRKEMEKKDKILAEKDDLLKAEKSKADFNAAKLKESAGEVVHLKAQVVELQNTLEAKDDEMVGGLKEAGFDAYRVAV